MGNDCMKETNSSPEAHKGSPFSLKGDAIMTQGHEDGSKEEGEAVRINLNLTKKNAVWPKYEEKHRLSAVGSTQILESYCVDSPSRNLIYSPVRFNDVALFALRNEKKKRMIAMGIKDPVRVTLHSDFKNRLNLTQETTATEKKQLVLDGVEYNLSRTFNVIDRDKDGKIGMFDLMREVKKGNPMMTDLELEKLQYFLDEVVGIYSSEDNHIWNLNDFMNFMQDAAELEKSPRKLQSMGISL